MMAKFCILLNIVHAVVSNVKNCVNIHLIKQVFTPELFK